MRKNVTVISFLPTTSLKCHYQNLVTNITVNKFNGSIDVGDRVKMLMSDFKHFRGVITSRKRHRRNNYVTNILELSPS